VPDVERFGYEMQAARRLGEAEAALGGDERHETRRVIRSLVRRAIERGWDGVAGGMVYSAGGGPHANPEKTWWVQAEAMRTLLVMAVEDSESPDEHFDLFVRQWEYIRDHVLDHVHCGWLPAGDDGGWPRLLRRWRHVRQPKADEWKDGSHDGASLLHCVRLLRGLPEDAALRVTPA